MQEPDFAVAELERAVKDLGMRGVEICTSVAGEELSNERFRKFFAKAEELDVLIFLHPNGFSDGDRLSDHYFTNVIGNGIKYTPDGGRVDVRLASGADGVTLSVADSGPGIPPELRERVLDRFFRVDSSRQAPGNGLGLSLVNAIAHQHGAGLALEGNEPGLKAVLSFPAALDSGRGSERSGAAYG